MRLRCQCLVTVEVNFKFSDILRTEESKRNEMCKKKNTNLQSPGSTDVLKDMTVTTILEMTPERRRVLEKSRLVAFQTSLECNTLTLPTLANKNDAN